MIWIGLVHNPQLVVIVTVIVVFMYIVIWGIAVAAHSAHDYELYGMWGCEPVNGDDITGEHPVIGTVSDVQIETGYTLQNDDWYLYGIIPPATQETVPSTREEP